MKKKFENISSEEMNKNHGEAVDFQRKMDDLIKSGEAGNYDDAAYNILLTESKNVRESGIPMENPIFPSRVALAREIAGKLESGDKIIFLRGIWRNGNTSLLRNIEQEFDASALPIHADFGGLALVDESEKIKKLNYDLGSEIGYKLSKVDSSTKHDYEVIRKDPLVYLDQYLEARPEIGPALVEIDEAVVAFAKEHSPNNVLINWMRNASSLKNIRLIVSAHRIAEDTGGISVQESFPESPQYYLGPLSEEESKIYISFLCSKLGICKNPEKIDYLYNLTGGRPYDIMTAFHFFFESPYSGAKEKGINADDLDIEMMKRMGSDFLDGSLSTRMLEQNYKKIAMLVLSNEEKTFIRKIIQEDVLVSDELDKKFTELLKLGIIRKFSINNSVLYKINGLALEQVLQKSIGIKNEKKSR